MRIEQWEPIYLKIVRDFGYSVSRDRTAARILSELLRPEQRIPDIESVLDDLISGKQCLIIGPCLSLPEVETILKESCKSNRIIVTVGEGTVHALDGGFIPNLVFTDLDGFPECDSEANRRGSIIVVHAHGDNIPPLKKFVPKLSQNVIPTCQCRPIQGICNWGGFTDGDRAFCALRHFKAADIRLMGFDFRRPCGEKQSNIDMKKKKLRWAEKIIEISRV